MSRARPETVSTAQCYGLEKFITYEVHEEGSERADDDEDEVESPPNVSEGRGGGLEVDKVGQSDSRHAETDALCADMVGEEFGVEDDAGYVDTHAVHCKEEVEHC